MRKLTEESSLHQDLDKMSTSELLKAMNEEDQKVAIAVHEAIPQIEKTVDTIWRKMKEGGRLFYIGAGTSGRLGILDASECPPTFGVPHDWVIGIISGGDGAIRRAVEFAEDDENQAWKDLKSYQIDTSDFVIGIAASGTTPYVIGGLKKCQTKGIATACICCNPNSKLSEFADFPIEVLLGPEFVTGSTRLKAGTAQKLILNMISTSVMIKLGRVKGNRMVDMQLSNNKLVDRGTKMVMAKTNLSYDQAKKILLEKGSVREAIDTANN